MTESLFIFGNGLGWSIDPDYFDLKTGLKRAWDNAKLTNADKQLILLVAQGFMGMSQPKATEVTLTAKVWGCAGIESHDQRSRVLKKIDQRCQGYWVERREGRTAVLHKGKNPNEIGPE